MSDPFDSLISGGASRVLLAGAEMFGQQQAQTAALRGQQAAREQDFTRYLLERDSRDMATRESARQFDLGLARENRLELARREESAFARLNAALDRQLKVAEIESRDRQQAFENTLKAMSFGISARKDQLEIQQLERAQKDQEAYDAVMRLSSALSLGLIKDTGELKDRLKQIASRSSGFLTLSDGARAQVTQMMSAFGQLAENFDLRPTASPGAKLSHDEMEKLAEGIDLTRKDFSEDQQMVLDDLFSKSGAVGAVDTRARMGKVLKYLNDNKDVPYLGRMLEQLESDPAAAASLRSKIEVGLVRPRLDSAAYAQLYEQQLLFQQAEADLDKQYGKAWRFSSDPAAKELREDLERTKKAKVAEIVSGGNPIAKHVAEGMYADFIGDVAPTIEAYVKAALRTKWDVKVDLQEKPAGSGIPDRNLAGSIRTAAGALAGAYYVPKYFGVEMPNYKAAEQRVEDARQAMLIADASGKRDVELLMEGKAARAAYLDVIRSAYVSAGLDDIPYRVKQMLDFDRLYPRSFAMQLGTQAREEYEKSGQPVWRSPFERSLQSRRESLPPAQPGAEVGGGGYDFTASGFK